MLSEKRRQLLLQNKEKIMAYQLSKLATEGRKQLLEDAGYAGCVYQYKNGLICAASACLTDDERAKIASNAQQNGCGIMALDSDFMPDFEENELSTLANFQLVHDNYCLNTNSERANDNFLSALESICTTGECNLPEQQEGKLSSLHDDDFEKIDGQWVKI